MTFDILIGIKDVLKVIDNWFSTPIIFENTLKNRFSIGYFLFEKEVLIGLLKVIDKQINDIDKRRQLKVL